MLAGGLAIGLAGRSSAASRFDGAVGIVVTPAGIADMISQSETGAAFDPALDWHIGSNTKAMTAALYARAVDRGRLRWGMTAGALFPGVALHDDWARTTVEDLMAHAAGLTDDLIDAAWLTARRADPSTPRRQRRAFVERLFAQPPAGQPGRYRYANANYVVLGAAIEHALDLDWETALQAELFRPLGMHGGFGAPPRSGIWGRQVVAGVPRPIDPAGIADNPPVLWPSGGVRLPPADYARFLASFLPGGPALLRPATLARLLMPVTPAARYAGGWSLQGPSDDPAAVVTHNGSNSLWFATATLSRRHGHGYAAMTNEGGAEGEATTAALIARMRGDLTD